MKKIFSSLLVSLLFLSLGTSLIYAAPPGGGNTGPEGGTGSTGCKSVICIENPFKVGNTLFGLMKTVVNDIILPLGGVLAVLAFIYSGFLYVMAQGNDAKLKTAHNSLLYTAIGTAVLLGSWVLANVVCETIEKLGGPICPTL